METTGVVCHDEVKRKGTDGRESKHVVITDTILTT
jgi:hypothetical protein